jgi:acyl-[acyl-carrier-protein] desaturase
MAREFTQRQLLEELEPAVAKELDRHLAIAKDWMPHEYVPWTEGRNFAGVFEDGSRGTSPSRRSATRPARPWW